MTTKSFNVRSVERGDRAGWERLWQGYREFYNSPLSPQVTDLTWSRFFDGIEPVQALVAAQSGHLVGLVHYIFHRSTALAGPTCYLQDLFTDAALRGKGIARALIEAVYERAAAAGAERVYWLTHETNLVARTLYDNVAERSGFIQYRKEL